MEWGNGTGVSFNGIQARRDGLYSGSDALALDGNGNHLSAQLCGDNEVYVSSKPYLSSNVRSLEGP